MKMKTEIKTEVKEEPFENFESREQDKIDCITSQNFDHSFNEPEFPTQKTDFAIKRKIREGQKESDVPLKKLMQDCNKSNHFAKSETFQKKTDLVRLDQRQAIHEKPAKELEKSPIMEPEMPKS